MCFMAADGPGNPFGNTGAYHITYRRAPQVMQELPQNAGVAVCPETDAVYFLVEYKLCFYECV